MKKLLFILLLWQSVFALNVKTIKDIEKYKGTVDQIFVTDSTVMGVESRFMPSIRKTIPLNIVTKVEVQDGKKNFHYVDNH